MQITNRLRRIREVMEQQNLDFSIIIEPDNQYYLTGFKAISYSRPILTIIKPNTIELIIPALEEDHAMQKAKVDKYHVYYEHPEQAHYGVSHLDHLKAVLKNSPGNKRIGIEFEHMPARLMAYIQDKGYSLSDVGDEIKEMRFIKDAEEIELMKKAGKLSDTAVNETINKTAAGMSELEIDSYGDQAMIKQASEMFPDSLVGYDNWTVSGIDRSSKPHLFSFTRNIEHGDMVTHSRQVWLDGYRAENERTYFIGKPSDKQLEMFKLAVEAQQVGLDVIKPGIPAKEVDLAARKVFAKVGLEDYAVHRIGHGIGLSEHEEPYLRFDNELILQEGMAFTIEPGLYVPGCGGFRHSDTVIITENGSISITNSPREVSELMF